MRTVLIIFIISCIKNQIKSIEFIKEGCLDFFNPFPDYPFSDIFLIFRYIFFLILSQKTCLAI